MASFLKSETDRNIALKSSWLKRVNLQVNDERMLDRQQDLFLVLDVVDLFEANDLGDRHHFQCEVLPRRSMPR